MGVVIGIFVLLIYFMIFWIVMNVWQYIVMLFFGWFIIVVNMDYFFIVVKVWFKMVGFVVFYVGFGMMIIGILAFGFNQEVIFNNIFVMEGLIEGVIEDQLCKNVIFFKDLFLIMGDYEVIYVFDIVSQFFCIFKVNYKWWDVLGDVVEEFNFYLNIFYDKFFIKVVVFNLLIKCYLDCDIFIYIVFLLWVEIDMEYCKNWEDSLNYKVYEVLIGEIIVFQDIVFICDQDIFFVKCFCVELVSIDCDFFYFDYIKEEGDLFIGAIICIQCLDEDSVFIVQLVLVLWG